MNFQLVYMSNASFPIESGELKKILTVARSFNKKHSITGVLLYSGGNFIQMLEGPEANVRALYEKISMDERHCSIKSIYEGHSETRVFGDWKMGYWNLENGKFIDHFKIQQLVRMNSYKKDNPNKLVLEILQEFREQLREDTAVTC